MSDNLANRGRARVTALPTATAYREGGGVWVIETNLLPPTQNRLDREYWRRRKERMDSLTILFRSARAEAEKRLGVTPPTFECAALKASLIFATNRVRDEANIVGGLKQHVDALVRSGWLAADDMAHLLYMPVGAGVNKDFPHVVLRLAPWDGKRE